MKHYNMTDLFRRVRASLPWLVGAPVAYRLEIISAALQIARRLYSPINKRLCGKGLVTRD